MRKAFALLALAAAGCAAVPPPTVLQPVGPPAAPLTQAPGYLVVATEVEPPPISADTMFCPHTSYAIYDRHGLLLRTVRNHLGPWDESPERVALRPGSYTISAPSQFGGDVLVPVIIREGATTRVDLERNRRQGASS